MLLGVFLYVTAFPLVFAWSFPFIVGGGIMALISLFVPESEGPVQPPEGSKFCVFCSTPMPVSAERCTHCNGLQPKE